MERELVEQARAGDRAAFEALVRLKVDAVYGTALAILGHEADAQDAVQEAFVAAWRSLAGLRDAERFEAWFGRIVVNTCRMSLRKRRGVRQITVQSAPADGPGSDGDLREHPSDDRPLADIAASADTFDRAFDRLTVDERALLVLRHRDELPVADIAARLGIPAGTVKSRLFTARRALERALAREDR
ncbi:MAG TPA: sigma-70 family RNA polymerase sigma factor [Candidatus Limnocylindrales bacterium]